MEPNIVETPSLVSGEGPLVTVINRHSSFRGSTLFSLLLSAKIIIMIKELLGFFCLFFHYIGLHVVNKVRPRGNFTSLHFNWRNTPYV